MPFFLFLFIFQAHSESISKSCRGKINICSEKLEKCWDRPYSLHAFIFYHKSNGELQKETHSFAFGGFLGDGKDFQFLDINDKTIRYANKKFTLSFTKNDSLEISLYSHLTKEKIGLCLK